MFLSDYLSVPISSLAVKYTLCEVFEDKDEGVILILSPVKRHWVVAKIHCRQLLLGSWEHPIITATVFNSPCCSKADVKFDARLHVFKAGRWLGNPV